MLRPVQRKTLYKEVMQALNGAIMAGKWQVGEKLPGEIALAQTFNVSRACIREVLKALSYSGILEIKPGSGTFLRELPNAKPVTVALDNLLDSDYTAFLEIRQVLHGQAAYWASERASPQELENLERIISEDSDKGLTEKHKLFHEEVVRLAKNPILLDMITQVEEKFKDLRELNFIVLPDDDRVEHYHVVDAIKSGPPSHAKATMMKHVTYVWKKH